MTDDQREQAVEQAAALEVEYKRIRVKRDQAQSTLLAKMDDLVQEVQRSRGANRLKHATS